MKVRFELHAVMVKDVDLKDFPQADDLDDATEQLLADYQDNPENLIAEATTISVDAEKLIVR